MTYLSREEELTLIASAQSGDQEAATKLLESMRGLIVSRLPVRFGSPDFDDWFQVGSLGAWSAIRNFDPSYGVRLSTLVYRYVMNAVNEEFRSRKKRVPPCAMEVPIDDGKPAYDDRLADTEAEVIRLRFVDVVINRFSDRERELIATHGNGESVRSVAARHGVSRQRANKQRQKVSRLVRESVLEMEANLK